MYIILWIKRDKESKRGVSLKAKLQVIFLGGILVLLIMILIPIVFFSILLDRLSQKREQYKIYRRGCNQRLLNEWKKAYGGEEFNPYKLKFWKSCWEEFNNY